MKRCFVFGNGPSNRQWLDITPHPSIGCNVAIRDWAFDHVVAVDRMAVALIRLEPARQNTQYWCKESSLELPPGWRQFRIPGIDSGSAAIYLATVLYPDSEIIAIGFDGILGGDNTTVYHYPFRINTQAPERIRLRHRLSCVELSRKHAIKFVWHEPDEQLRTIDYDTARAIAETQS